MTTQHASTEAIRKQVRVECSAEQAFRTFTEGIGSWWPLHTHSVSVMADGAAVPETAVMEPGVGGRLYERTRGGRECDWGRILVWEPPSQLLLEWRVNPANPPTQVEVRFVPDGNGTRVELEHRGWERYPPDRVTEARSSYNAGSGWESVLGAYSQAVR